MSRELSGETDVRADRKTAPVGAVVGRRGGGHAGFLLAAWLLGCGGAFAGTPVDLPRFPSISPDGSEIVFSWRGDLWRAPVSGGTAVRLTSHPADELASAWSPDGSLIAFESERDGFRNLYLMRPDGAGLRQLTFSDLALSLMSFGLDGEGRPAVHVAAAIEGDVYRGPRPYEVPVSGGPPRRVHDAFGTEPAASPDGRRVAFTRGGSSWDRRHYRGSDRRDLWLYDRGDGTFQRLTEWEGNDGKARWVGPNAVAFLSDREGDTVNLFLLPLDGRSEATPLTRFRDRDIHDFDISADGTTAVLARWNELYRLDLADPHAVPEPIAVVAPEDAGETMIVQDVSGEVTEAVLSPDGKVMAMVAFGDLHVRPVEGRGSPRRVTTSVARVSDAQWSPDGSRIYFTSDESGVEGLYVAMVERTRGEIRTRYEAALGRTPAAPPAAEPDPTEPDPAVEPDPTAAPAAPVDPPAGDSDDPAAEAPDAGVPEPARLDPDPKRWQDAVTFRIEPLLVEATSDRRPRISPDGRRLLFLRDGGTLCVLELGSGEVRELLPGWDRSTEFEWSPDGRWIALSRNDHNFNRDIFLMPLDGSNPPINVTRHPDREWRPRFSPDGRMLAFLSDRVGDEADAWMVLLDRTLERMTAAELADHFEEAAKQARRAKPISPVDLSTPAPEVKAAATPAFTPADLADAYRRLRRVTTMNGSEGNLEVVAGGERLAFTANAGGTEGPGIFTTKWDGSDLKRVAGTASIEGVSLDGQTLVLVQGGRARTQPIGGGAAKTVAPAERLVLDRQAWNLALFDEAARVLGQTFYLDPAEKGLDWEALVAEYRQLATAARTPSELTWVVNRLFGELNASHLGFRAASDPTGPRQTQGRLGTILEPVEGGFRVAEILPGSPAELTATPLAVGDLVVAVEFEPLQPGETVEQRLQGRVGRETAISVRRPTDAGEIELDCLVVPVSVAGLRNLIYEETQRRSAALVDEWSEGRLGYTHIRAMNQPSLDEFERDLFAAADGRDGLLIDVRNNGGGSTADRLLASIMVRPHAYTVPRGGDRSRTDAYPQDRLFIQRYVLPINMLCNEKSFSNAEITAHAFKTLGRGTLVGMPTYGGVISTGSHRLVDGSTIRVPFRGWYLPCGTDMENNGAIPDLLVPQTPQDEVAGFDRQLRVAVDDLLERLTGSGN